MQKKEPGSKNKISPDSDVDSEKRIPESEDLVASPLPLTASDSADTLSIEPVSPENPETKNVVSEAPLKHLDDSGDWAEESKYVLTSSATAHETAQERPVDLPPAYGFARLIFLVRDPNWIFAFWEIPPENAHELLARLQCSWDQVHWVLRMYSPGKETASQDSHWDTAIDPAASGWYLHLSPPGASFQGEIGLCDDSDRFAGLTCSNRVTLPPDRPSPFVDEQWPITKADHETHYAGLPVALQQVSVKMMSPELIEQWQADRPTSRPNPFGKR